MIRQARKVSTVMIAIIAGVIVWWSFIGFPKDLLGEMESLSSAKITCSRNLDQEAFMLLQDRPSLDEIECFLRSHWDYGRSNLSLMEYTLVVTDMEGKEREFLFSINEFGQFGHTPEVLKRAIVDLN